MAREIMGDVEKALMEAEKHLSERDTVREQALQLGREIVRRSGRSITYFLSGRFEESHAELGETRRLAKRLLELLKPYPDLYYSGSTYNAISEYVEAELLHSIVLEDRLPGPAELGVPIPPYLQGLGDVVGELRRLCLEKIRRGEFKDAWSLLERMEAIYLGLRRLDYPDALMPGVRHKADVARRLVDDTKALLIAVSRQGELADNIARLLIRLSGEESQR